MDAANPLLPTVASSLAVALISSSRAPLLLLADDLTIVGASSSFCSAFGIDPSTANGTKLLSLGQGEWASPQLQTLLRATFDGAASIDAYEMNLVRDGQETACLVLNAHKLEYHSGDAPRIVLAVADITAARTAEKVKDELVKKNQMLLQELQHRVANSLQIIASVLLQSARRFNQTKLALIFTMLTIELCLSRRSKSSWRSKAQMR